MQKIASNDLFDMAAVSHPEAHRHLVAWAEYTRQWRPNIGYPRRSAGLSTGGGSGDEAFDHLCDAADKYAAQAADAIVNALPPPYSAILCHTYLCSVFRFRNDPAEALADALAAFWVQARHVGLS